MTFQSPNYTQVPNDLFDSHMKDMGEAELRVVLVVTRKTLGFHKDKDPISWTQIMEMSGLSKSGTQDGIDQAIQHNHIECVGQGARGVNVYRLVFSDYHSPSLTGIPVTPELVSSEYPQKKEESIKEIPSRSASAPTGRRRDYQNVKVSKTGEASDNIQDKNKIILERVQLSSLVKTAMNIFGVASLTLDAKTVEILTQGRAITVKDGTRLMLSAPIKLFDEDEAFNKFCITRFNALKAINVKVQDALKNIAKYEVDPTLEGFEGKMPGYIYWLNNNRIAIEGQKPKEIQYDAPEPE